MISSVLPVSRPRTTKQESAKALSVTAIALLFAALAPALCSAQETKPEIRIGVIAPLTLGNAKFGEDIRRAVELALEQTNGRSSPAYHLQAIFEDGKCGSGNSAATAASKLIDVDRVSALIVGCSGEILQAAPIAERKEIPTVAVFASHPKVKQLGHYIFRVFVDAENDIPIIADQIKRDARTRLVIISEEIAFTAAIRDVLQRELGKRTIASVDYPEGEQDFRTVLLKIKQHNPDSIFLNSASHETLSVLVRQMATLGMTTPKYSFAYAGVPAFIDSSAQYADGLTFVGTPELDQTNPLLSSFAASFSARFGADPNALFVAAAAYDGTSALISALERGNGESKRTIEGLKEYSGEGLLGGISFDENGDVRNLHYVLKRFVNGRPVQVGYP